MFTPPMSTGEDFLKLHDVGVLTLHQDRNTEGSKPIPQLTCQGRHCALRPSVVQCKNTGTDGTTIHWRCEADLNEKLRFGETRVSCQGLRHPGDHYIVPGSCGLQFTLERTDEFAASSSLSSFQFFMIFGLLAVAVVMIFLPPCKKATHSSSNDHPPPYTPPKTKLYPNPDISAASQDPQYQQQSSSSTSGTEGQFELPLS